MKRKQVIQIIGAIGLIVVVAGTTAFAGKSGMKVATQTVESAAITQTVEAEGHIESENEKVYYAAVSAPIEAFSLENGDLVEKGERLVWAKLQVEVHIKNPDEHIYLGTDVDVTIETGAKEQAVLIPNTALYADDGGDYCYLLENGVIAKRYLTCGLSGDDMTEVTAGLSGGEQVITEAMTDEKIGKSAQGK